MPIPKESVTINFSQGLETFSDPNQLPAGKFVALTNSSFIKSGTGEYAALKKRNGFGSIIPSVSTVSYLTTYNTALVGLGPGAIQGYSTTAKQWINQGYFNPVILSTTPMIRNSYNQSNQDATISPNGMIITAFASGNVASPYQYAIFDSVSGQNVVPQTALPLNGGSQVIGQPQTFTLGSSFFLVYAVTSTATSQLVLTQTQNISPFSVQSTTKLDSSIFFHNNGVWPYEGVVTPGPPRPMFDGCVGGDRLYVSWVSGTTAHLNAAVITSPFLTIGTTSIVTSTSFCACISVAPDVPNSIFYTTTASSFALNYCLNNFSFIQLFTTSAVVSSSSYYMTNLGGNSPAFAPGITNVTSFANGYLWSAYETRSIFAVPLGVIAPTTTTLVTRQVSNTGVVGSETVICNQMGLGSKPAVVGNDFYFVSTYGSPTNLQNTYFLLGSSGAAISKFAYESGGGYYNTGIPSMTTVGSSAYVSYLTQDLLTSVASANLTGSSSQVIASNQNVYTQTGINLGKFNFSSNNISPKDTGNALSIPSGCLFNYSGLQCVENNFHLFPEPTALLTISIGSGSSFSVGSNEWTNGQAYQYQLIYQWSDEQANIHRSATSLPMTAPVGGTIGSITYQPTFNLLPVTQKQNYTASLFRWSPQQPEFFKVGAVTFTLPMSQTQTTSSVSAGTNLRYRLFGHLLQFIDFAKDSDILGNEILYTTGNNLEDTGLPACSAGAVWDARFWTILSETGEIAFSKPIIPATPIEMAQDQTIFVPSSQTAQGPSGPPVCIFPMDDKLIIFRKNGILYINGTGPDITGANGQYSEPIQIPSGFGCSNQSSIVLTPIGIMFQSDNGIWLLGRDLSTKFIGKDIEAYNNQTVLSANCIPGSTEVRFELNGGSKLVYDYFVDQWNSDSPMWGQSSVIYNGLHTFVNSSSSVFQESQGIYLDGSTPVTMGFTTGWISLAGLQGYKRAYWMDILATYQSGHTYTMGIAYDFNPAIVQTATIVPTNTVGSGSFVEQWQINFQRQQCQSFQLTFNEISSGSAGAGLTLSAINLVYGKKKSFPRNISPKNRTS